MTVETPQNVSTNEAVTNAPKLTENNTDVKEPENPSVPVQSPAQDLRNLQLLLVSGIYPGQMAPQVVASYTLLEKMAQKIEQEAGYTKETK